MSDDENNTSYGLISEPQIADQSVGSSISTSMQQEYDDLLKFSVVVPTFDSQSGSVTQILENAKGLFMTKEAQIQLKQHLEQQKRVNLKFEEKKRAKKTVVIKEEEEHQSEEQKQKENNKTNIDDTLDGMSTSINSNSSSLSNSFSPKHQHNGLLRPVHNNYFNNQDSNNFTTITSEEEVIRDSFNNTLFLNNIDEKNENNTTNDINPRKHSPVPISPPTNLDFTTDNSIEIIQNHIRQKQLKNHQSQKQQPLHSSMDEKFKNDVKMTHSLDKWFKEFKTHVISELEKSRLQIMEQQQKRLIEEKERQSAEILKLQHEIDSMKQSFSEHEKNTERKDNVISNLSKALDKQREKTEAQRVEMELKIQRVENSRETFTANIAEKFRQNRIKSKVFLNWHSLFISKHKIKVEKACKKKAEEVCLELANQYEEKIKKLEEELRRSKVEIDKYKYEMGRYEENMKRALMRGVCALNLEAMSIFNEENCNNTNNTRKAYNSHNLVNNENNNINSRVNIETYYSNEDLNRLDNNNNELNQQKNEQLFKSSMNSFGRKINENENGLKNNVIFNYEKPHQSATTNSINSTSTATTRIPTIIIENNKTNSIDQIDNNKLKLNNQIKNTSNKSNIKAKVNSNPNATAYRSIIIEKHTKTPDDINKVYQYLPTTTTIGNLSNGTNKIVSNAKKNLLIKCSN